MKASLVASLTGGGGAARTRRRVIFGEIPIAGRTYGYRRSTHTPCGLSGNHLLSKHDTHSADTALCFTRLLTVQW